MKKLLTILLLALLPFTANAGVRAFHFVLRAITLERAFWIVDTLVENQYNTIVPLITDGVDLDNQVWVSRSDSWTKLEFITFIKYAQSKGIRVVPELKLLTHQEKFFAANRTPEKILMFNKNTYNVSAASNTIVYGKVYALIDELIDIIHPTAFHIGHDELAGWDSASYQTDLNYGDIVLPAGKYYNDIIYLHNYLLSKKITTWMWADMLESPSEFPTMRKNNLHGGNLLGYGKTLRDRLPKDIVLCDWHYKENLSLVTYTSLNTLTLEGFRTLGAVWLYPEAFSKSAKLGGSKGMIATSWSYVQLRDWSTVYNIIVNSGKSFNKYF